MDFWPGHDLPMVQPVVINANRPGRNRPRLSSAHLNHHPMYYTDINGGLLVPASSVRTHHRSSSNSGPRPTVIINNENGQWDDFADQRPRSAHGHRYYVEPHRRHRSRSRPRSRTPSPYYDSETEKRLRKLEELEKKEQEEARKKRIEEELIIAKAEEAKKKKEADELKKKAVEEWEAEEKKRKEKEKKAKEEADKEYNERMRKTLRANGYSEEEIDRMLKKAEKKEKGGQLVIAEHKHKVVDLPRPTYMKVHTRYIDTYTLDTYDLPWDYDEVSALFNPFSSRLLIGFVKEVCQC